MKYDEAREKFVSAWGSLGTNWGINKTMAQIHALLLISEKPLSTDDIMEEVSISRGNANMNIRSLMDWGLVTKTIVTGERKDYFIAGKDIWKVAVQIIRERKKRELEPVINILYEMKNIEGGNEEQIEEFNKIISEMNDFTTRVDKMLETLVNSDKHWFKKQILNLLTS